MRGRFRYAVQNRRAATFTCFSLVSMLGMAWARAEESSTKPKVELDAPDGQRAAPANESERPAAGSAAESSRNPPNVASARALFWEGYDQYEQGNYVAAIALFERSYAASPQPGTLFNIALATAGDRRCEDAALAFRRFSELPMPEAELQRASTIFDSAQSECLGVAARGTIPVVAPHLDPPAREEKPAPSTPKPNPSKAPTASPRKDKGAESERAHLPSELGESYWSRDHILGWSFAAGAAVSAGAALYFNQRQRNATDEAHDIRQVNLETGEPADAAGRMEDIKRERDAYLIGSGVSAAASVGLTIAAVKLLMFSDSTGGSTEVTIVVTPATRVAIAAQF